jgi:hypothetical protein
MQGRSINTIQKEIGNGTADQMKEDDRPGTDVFCHLNPRAVLPGWSYIFGGVIEGQSASAFVEKACLAPSCSGSLFLDTFILAISTTLSRVFPCVTITPGDDLLTSL